MKPISLNPSEESALIRAILKHLFFGPAFLAFTIFPICAVLLTVWAIQDNYSPYYLGALFFLVLLNIVFWASWRNKARVEALIDLLPPDKSESFRRSHNTNCLAGNMRFYEMGVRFAEKGSIIPNWGKGDNPQWSEAIMLGYELRKITKWA